MLPTDQVITPAGRQIEFEGRPIALALHPNGRTATVLTAGKNPIVVVDLESASVRQKLDLAGAHVSYAGLLYAPDGLTLYASLADGTIGVFSVASDGTLAPDGRIGGLPRSAIGHAERKDDNPYPGGLALSDDARRLYVVLNRANSVAVIDRESRAVMAEIKVGNAPHAIAVRGGRAYVSNQGGRLAQDGDVTLGSSGARLVVDATIGHTATGTVSVLDLDKNLEIAQVPVGLQPTALLIAGERLFVANTNSDTVSVLDLVHDRALSTFSVQPFARAPLGSSPNSLALYDPTHLGRARSQQRARRLRPRRARVRPAAPRRPRPDRLVPAVGRGGLSAEGGRRGQRQGRGIARPRCERRPRPFEQQARPLGARQPGERLARALAGRRGARTAVRERGSQQRLGQDSAQRGPQAGRSTAADPRETGRALGVSPRILHHQGEPNLRPALRGASAGQWRSQARAVRRGRDAQPPRAGRRVRSLRQPVRLRVQLGRRAPVDHPGVRRRLHRAVVRRVRPQLSVQRRRRARPPHHGLSLDAAILRGRTVRNYGEYIDGLAVDTEEVGAFGLPREAAGGAWTAFYRDAKLLAERKDSELHARVRAHTELFALSSITNAAYPPFNTMIPISTAPRCSCATSRASFATATCRTSCS